MELIRRNPDREHHFIPHPGRDSCGTALSRGHIVTHWTKTGCSVTASCWALASEAISSHRWRKRWKGKECDRWRTDFFMPALRAAGKVRRSFLRKKVKGNSNHVRLRRLWGYGGVYDNKKTKRNLYFTISTPSILRKKLTVMWSRSFCRKAVIF